MLIRAVIFDMDGTITAPYLDFDAIRAEIGNVKGPILEAMAGMSPAERARAEAILDRHEVAAAENSQLNDGAAAALEQLRAEGRLIGILTRNCHASVQRVAELHNLKFDVVVTREDGPVKPDPFGVRRACELLSVSPDQGCVVGDYVFDLTAARRAGATSILLSTHERYREFLPESDHLIHRLGELPALLTEIENDAVSVK